MDPEKYKNKNKIDYIGLYIYYLFNCVNILINCC